MILPIYAYGHPVLRTKAKEIAADYEDLFVLIENMFETMDNAAGIGLAAPQIGKSIRLFVIDTTEIESDSTSGMRKVFINPSKVEETGTKWGFEEGCLSIPDIRGEVMRPSEITLRYQNQEFEFQTETFTGMNARVIQHEYDHLEGILFIEELAPLKRRMLRRKLDKIRKGRIDHSYPMTFVEQR